MTITIYFKKGKRKNKADGWLDGRTGGAKTGDLPSIPQYWQLLLAIAHHRSRSPGPNHTHTIHHMAIPRAAWQVALWCWHRSVPLRLPRPAATWQTGRVKTGSSTNFFALDLLNSMFSTQKCPKRQKNSEIINKLLGETPSLDVPTVPPRRILSESISQLSL